VIVEEGVLGNKQLLLLKEIEEEIDVPQPYYPSPSQCTVRTPFCANVGGCNGDAEYLAE
jgi:hypothetical protein